MAAVQVVQLTSVDGVVSLLDEDDGRLQVHALKQLDQMMPHHWMEIAAAIPQIEALYDDETYQNRQLAALVVSKCFYHLEALDDSLKYALGAGPLFDVNEASEYVETLASKCIDEYIALRVFNSENKEEKPIDSRLQVIVESLFERSFSQGQFKQVLGIAVESRRLDIIQSAVKRSGQPAEMLRYLYDIAQHVVVSRGFREQVLRVLVDLYRSLDVPDYINMSQCLLFLDDHQAVADILFSLVKSNEMKQVLMAYQVAFELNENQNQPFLLKVSNAIPGATDSSEPSAAGDSGKPGAAGDLQDRLTKLKSILSGEVSTKRYLHFLYGHCKSDLNILKNIQEKIEVRNATTHTAAVMANAFMNCGTSVDTFLKDNLPWLSKATNWAKFTATASTGVIHKGHTENSLKLLQPFLPQAGQSGSPYQEGGALFAMGLIHANQGGDKIQFLLESLRNAGANEIVQHGACLGIGLAAMATQDKKIFEVLKAVVFSDSAVAGEAAGLAMGLVLLGSGDGEAIQEMLAYAHDTKHEKIIRGISVGIALIAYGQEEAAETLIEQLSRDKDPILRYGCMYAIALAYVGTGNNRAIKRLLHVAVSDVSDDVRRAAVTALGFVLCASPSQLPRIVSLLAESYNPHVRYGACFAVGIACAGLGLKEAIDLLEPLLKDRVDYVKQAAFIATSMVLLQHNKTKEPRVEVFRKSIMDAVESKHDTMAKFGAIIAAGILDAGGRNVTISLLSPAGHKKMAAIVGMAIFPQFWYWFPLIHFLSLSFTPTAVIGLNQNLELPKGFTFLSHARPSMYAYPPPIPIKKKEEKKKLPTAQLSVTAKLKAKKKKSDGMETEEDKEKDNKEKDNKEKDNKEKDNKEKDKEKDNKEKDKAGGKDKDAAMADADSSSASTSADDEKKVDSGPEPASEVLSNPSRVTWAQQRVISFTSQRYQPIKQQLAGVVMLYDSSPDQPEELVVQQAPKLGVPGVSPDEPAPPEPFEFRR